MWADGAGAVLGPALFRGLRRTSAWLGLEVAASPMVATANIQLCTARQSPSAKIFALKTTCAWHWSSRRTRDDVSFTRPLWTMPSSPLVTLAGPKQWAALLQDRDGFRPRDCAAVLNS